MKVCIIIPTYNESLAIGGLVRQIHKHGWDVLVVDDGSSDATAQISQDNGAIVLRNQENQGKGFSLIRGLKYVLDKNFDAAITMDGDGQHSPEDILRFINEAQVSQAGIIIGNRMQSTDKMPAIRVLTNKFMSWFISRLIRQSIPDTQCGFRLIKKELLARLKFTTHRFETESEILFQASNLGYHIQSVPIKTIYQKEKSQINPFIDTIRFFSFIWRQIWTTPS
ncbi:MAG: glycosyltransferase family 2 protein [Candidatus Omnitrophota bacterium]|jgi:glycosyltransferase involved in cell wall biosynthesis